MPLPSQGIECAPQGVEPKAYPVFSKPICNLRGMGISSRVVRDAAEMCRATCGQTACSARRCFARVD